MRLGSLGVCADSSAAAWIAPRLGGPFGAVTRTVPGGFAAYARICHPVRDQDGVPYTWTQIARSTGRRAHPLMQWHQVAGSVAGPDATSQEPVRGGGATWRGLAPDRGSLDTEALAALCGVLAAHTTTQQQCLFCVWNGRPPSRTPPAAASDARPAGDEPEWFRLSGRDYLLLAGPLHGALEVGWWPSADWFEPHSPNLFWPADQAWCVATEVGRDSTLVAGSRQLVDALLSAPRLEAWPVGPDASMTADADEINA